MPRLPRLPKVVLPTLSAVALVFAIHTVVTAQKVEPAPPPLVPPPKNPYPATIAGAGIIEPANERAAVIGPPTPAVVLHVFCSVGDVVSQGAPLFQLDDRSLRAERKVREATRDIQRAKLRRLEAMPRPEEVPALAAQVDEARNTVADFEAQLARLEKAYKAGQGVVSIDELDHRRFQVMGARRGLERAEAQLALTRAGAWQPDLLQARAELAQAEAALAQTETEIERLMVRAPTDGSVLQVNVRDGEYATTTGNALIVFGDTRTLHVRVDVDEESAPLVRPNRRAEATLKGFPGQSIPLEFVRIEPYVSPKKSLTGDNTERVDTRVLQVIFKLGKTTLPVYVGQQVDVFMESEARDMSGRGPTTSVTSNAGVPR